MGKMASPMLFEKDFIHRALGSVVSQPDVALTELVANAWDAGATQVEVTIPEGIGGDLVVKDNGTGMTADEFDLRWRTLRYDRRAHQGTDVEFPPDVERRPRVAYGRNGVGRHAMFCFAPSYVVETTKEGHRNVFRITEASGDAPFDIEKDGSKKRKGHGTRLRCGVQRRLPAADEMRQILSARFLHDPEFVVSINGESVPLSDHDGLLVVEKLEFFEGLEATIYVVDARDTARTKFQHGIAFWVGRRLVGKPGWTLADRALLDGRTREAKRLTFIVKAESLRDHVREDWSGFKPTPEVAALEDKVADLVDKQLRTMLSGKVEAKVKGVIQSRRERVRKLSPLSQLEVAQFARMVAEDQPLVADEVLAAAVDTLIRLDDGRSGQALIRKLALMDSSDVEGLNRLLEDWSVRDALVVLDEVGRRIRVVEAVEKLAADSNVDELHTLHPLVTQARWLFGPQYDSLAFTSNITIRRVIEHIVGKPERPLGYENPKKRPDLVFLAGSTVSTTAVEGWEDELATIEQILLLELKRGGSTIRRDDVFQADGYVQDLLGSGDLRGNPKVSAFVVGAKVDPKALARNVEDPNGQERGRVVPVSYDQLVQTANRRLFNLRNEIEPRFPEGADSDLLKTALKQQSLL